MTSMGSIAFIGFTRRGCELAKRLASCFGDKGLASTSDGSHAVSFDACSVCGPARFADELSIGAYESLAAWTAEHFTADEALVFVGATGIAVRAIAPHVRDKFSDPAVVSVDEAGMFVVPLLSGHVGGANELARAVAAETGGLAVVSTATDVNGLFAVDEWAARNGLAIGERVLAKRVSAALLDGQTIGFSTDEEVEGPLPTNVVSGDAARGLLLGFSVSLDDTLNPFSQTLHLVPQVVTVGVGCRRGCDPAVLEESVAQALATARVSSRAVVRLASIDVKRGERAIEELAARYGWELCFYTADELMAVPGTFTASDFVKKTVGVDNVCERAALAQGGTLLLGKQPCNGTTVALARKGSQISLSM